MGRRSRSRSRSRDRKKESHRDKERDRDRDRKNREKERHKRKSRSRSRSRHRRDKRSRSPRTRRSSSSSSTGSTTYGLTLGNLKPKQQTSLVPDRIFNPNELEGKSQEEIEMMKVMGFSGFDTTKGKHVDGACNAYAVNIQQKRKYRQYMNRKGGFNRPLDPVA